MGGHALLVWTEGEGSPLRRASLVIVVMLAAGLAPSPAGAAEVGIVLLHGKGLHSGPSSPVGKLAAKLDGAGILVALPDMPWSRDRAFDASYEDALREITAAVDGLRRAGASKVVVGGHSIGANAALGYGAFVGGVDGVAALGPGQVPDRWAENGVLVEDVAKARAMVTAGRGDERATFGDINQGEQLRWITTPEIYLSYWDPEGPAVMPKSVAALRGMPLFLAIGTADRLYHHIEAYIFDRAPPHDRSVLVEVDAGHGNTPIKAWKALAGWLKGL